MKKAWEVLDDWIQVHREVTAETLHAVLAQTGSGVRDKKYALNIWGGCNLVPAHRILREASKGSGLTPPTRCAPSCSHSPDWSCGMNCGPLHLAWLHGWLPEPRTQDPGPRTRALFRAPSVISAIHSPWGRTVDTDSPTRLLPQRHTPPAPSGERKVTSPPSLPTFSSSVWR